MPLATREPVATAVDQLPTGDVDDHQIVVAVVGEVVDHQLTRFGEHDRLHAAAHVEVPCHIEPAVGGGNAASRR